ncbi:MAG: ABC transporter permease [bacterium]|nr:ABC transporter permease [bacterium]
MARFLIRRSFLLLVTMFLTSMLIFALTQLLPGDIALLALGRDAGPEALAEYRDRFGLDDPLPIQYANWATGFIMGDWGRSYNRGNPPVRPIVMERLGNSLRLAGMTLLLSIPVSILLGVIAALREDTVVDSAISVFSLAVVGLPEFVTGIVFINVFAHGLGWFPATSIVSAGFSLGDWLRVLFLPALTATLVLLAYVSRMTRAGVIDELRKPYVRTATLKGLPRRQVIFKHVLRNALLPTITVIAISIGWLIGGLVVIEEVFNYPGLGRELVAAVKAKNIPLLQSSVMIVVFFFAFANLLADVVYAILNPRIRLS